MGETIFKPAQSYSKEDLKFFDPQIEVKEQAVAERLQFLPNSEIPLPSEVEISESGMCNRKCSFCPRSDPDYDHRNEFISYELHKKDILTFLNNTEISDKFLLDKLKDIYQDNNSFLGENMDHTEIVKIIKK